MSKPTTDTLSDEQLKRLRDELGFGYGLANETSRAVLDELLRLRGEHADIDSMINEVVRLRIFVADTCEGFVCLPQCDSLTHAELCPTTNPVAAWRQMCAEVDRLRDERAQIDTPEKWMRWCDIRVLEMNEALTAERNKLATGLQRAKEYAEQCRDNAEGNLARETWLDRADTINEILEGFE